MKIEKMRNSEQLKKYGEQDRHYFGATLTLCGRGFGTGTPLKASQIDILIGAGLPSLNLISVTDISYSSSR